MSTHGRFAAEPIRGGHRAVSVLPPARFAAAGRMCCTLLMLVSIGLARPAPSEAQRATGAGRAGAAPTARANAPIDLTGYWVSVVTQDWRWRMITPPKGDYASIPITLEAKRVGDTWDSARDEAAGEQCKAYGAPALMAVPTRLRISWADDNTLRVEADAGTQTRDLHFGNWKPPAGPPSWQGASAAEWERSRGRGATSIGGSLNVVTTRLRAGYLRKNGVPYSADAVLTEHWDLSTDPRGDRWITITSSVEDAKYLREPWVSALNFKREPDGAKWDPTPCSAR